MTEQERQQLLFTSKQLIEIAKQVHFSTLPTADELKRQPEFILTLADCLTLVASVYQKRGV